ncbi:MAG: TIGR03571 family LLM class oxidoreductase [Desertimonas sp.]
MVDSFERINRGYDQLTRPGRLTVGVAVPIENHGNDPVATMDGHLERARLVEQLGFAGLWIRDVPFFDPNFGDAGQVFDPFVYLGQLAAVTDTITLGVGSIALPLHHPANVAKAAASADRLSGGRLVLGIASGDRPVEYPAMNIAHRERGERYREAYHYIRAMAEPYPVHRSAIYGHLDGRVDLLPKPMGGKLPMLVTGGSQQSDDWIARHGDGWLAYPRPLPDLERVITGWRQRIAALGQPDRPYFQSLLVDIDDGVAEPQGIHLGYRMSTAHLAAYLRQLRSIGVNHVGLSLRFNRADVVDTLKRISAEVLPEFG